MHGCYFSLQLTLTILNQDFVTDKERAERWTGLRQDSGDPYTFAPLAKAAYDSLGIDVHKKLIIYSDSLTVDKALKLKEQCSGVGFIGQFISTPSIARVLMERSVVRHRDAPDE